MQELSMIRNEVLLGLADAIFPLGAYLAKSKRSSYSPWRKPGEASISLGQFGLVEFFRQLLTAPENADDATLAKRWSALEHDPLRELKRLFANAQSWRRDRLSQPQEPVFGIFESENFEIHGKAGGMSRAAFYKACFKILDAIVNTEKPDTTEKWSGIATRLLNEAHPGWQNESVSSSEFIQQLVRDVFRCLMGMKSKLRDPSGQAHELYASEPLQYAILVELGETRRVGNAHSVEDVERAVATLRMELNNKSPLGR
jgi:hypothetical protein